MAAEIARDFSDLEPTVPSLDGYKSARAGDVFTCGGLELGFDEGGAISHLVDGRDGYSWADAEHTLCALLPRHSPWRVLARQPPRQLHGSLQPTMVTRVLPP